MQWKVIATLKDVIHMQYTRKNKAPKRERIMTVDYGLQPP